jgi:hypothetical protein
VSASLIRFQPVELEVLGQSAAIFAKACQEFSGAGRFTYFKYALARGMNLDDVAFLEAESLYDHSW